MDRCDRVAPGCYVPDLIEDRVVRCLDGCTEGENPGDDDVHTSSAWVDGGHRIRTCKGLRPPVFKTGALAIRPALPVASNLLAGPRLLKLTLRAAGLRYTFGSQFAQEQDRPMSNSRVLFRRNSRTDVELARHASRYVEVCPARSLSWENCRL